MEIEKNKDIFDFDLEDALVRFLREEERISLIRNCRKLRILSISIFVLRVPLIASCVGLILICHPSFSSLTWLWPWLIATAIICAGTLRLIFPIHNEVIDRIQDLVDKAMFRIGRISIDIETGNPKT